MVKKIKGDFSDDNFERILSKISKDFDFMYTDETLYVALRKYSKRHLEEELIKKAFRPARLFIIKEMDKDMVEREKEIVADWCTAKFVALERQKYEQEQQAKLKQAMQALDLMEEKLQKAAQESKENALKTKKEGGGKEVGKQQQERQT